MGSGSSQRAGGVGMPPLCWKTSDVSFHVSQTRGPGAVATAGGPAWGWSGLLRPGPNAGGPSRRYGAGPCAKRPIRPIPVRLFVNCLVLAGRG